MSSSAIAPGRSFSARSSAAQARATAETWPAPISFGIVTTKFAGSRLAVARASVVTNRSSVRRLRACSSVRHRLDPDADEWRQRARLETGGDLLGDRYGMAVLFGVRPDAVAVLEVDAEVLDRLARQLVDDAAANGLGQRRARPAPARAPRQTSRASGAYSSSTERATAPILAAESALKRCAPP